MIIIPVEHPYGQKVEAFLTEELEPFQYVEVLDKLSLYAKFSLQQLLLRKTVKKIRPGLYYVRVKVSRANLRFWAAACAGDLYLLDVFKKKSQELLDRDIARGEQRVRTFSCDHH